MMRMSPLVVLLASLIFAISSASAQVRLGQAMEHQLVGDGCGTPSLASIYLGDETVQVREGDLVCVHTDQGSMDCGDAFSTSSNDYSCPTNGNEVDCGAGCGDCATGNGTKADCESCCAHFHSGAGLRVCKNSYC